MAVKVNNTTVIDDSRNAVFAGLESTTLPLVLNGRVTYTKVVSVSPVSGTYTLDCSSGNYFQLSTLATSPTIRFSNIPSIGLYSMTILLTNGASDKTISWPTTVISPPIQILTSASMIVNLYTEDSGESWISSILFYN